MAAADAAGPRRLAVTTWRLHGEAGVAQTDIERLHGLLRSRPPGGARPAPNGSMPVRPVAGHLPRSPILRRLSPFRTPCGHRGRGEDRGYG